MELDEKFKSTLPQELTRAMWCQRCFNDQPVHMIWYTIWVSSDQKYACAQQVCDDCLDTAVRKMDTAARNRRHLGQETTMVRVAPLES